MSQSVAILLDIETQVLLFLRYYCSFIIFYEDFIYFLSFLQPLQETLLTKLDCIKSISAKKRTYITQYGGVILFEIETTQPNIFRNL
jgi:hypothetical protein